MEKIDIALCEKCSISDNCNILDPKKCNNFVAIVDSNYKYVFDPELSQIEKQNFT
jgi:hypothetical protein